MRAFTSNFFERLCQFWTWMSPGGLRIIWYCQYGQRCLYICLIVMMIGAMWKQIVARNLSSCAPLLSTNKTLWGRPCATLDRAIHFLYINAKDNIFPHKCSFLILFILGNGFSSFGELNPGSAGGCSWKGSCQSCQANHGFFSIFAFHLKFMSTRALCKHSWAHKRTTERSNDEQQSTPRTHSLEWGERELSWKMCFCAEVATEHYSQIWLNTSLCAEK